MLNDIKQTLAHMDSAEIICNAIGVAALFAIVCVV